VLCISHSGVNLCLLRLSVLKEVNRYLREECICQHIFILLHPLLTLFAKCIQLVGDEIRRTACDDVCVFSEDLLLKLCVHWFYCRAVSSGKDILCLLCRHLIALTHQHVEYCLCSNDL